MDTPEPVNTSPPPAKTDDAKKLREVVAAKGTDGHEDIFTTNCPGCGAVESRRDQQPVTCIRCLETYTVR